MPRHTRYDRVANSYSRYRPRYPDALIVHLADRIGRAGTPAFVLDIGSGARDALRTLAAPHRTGGDRVLFGCRFACLTVRCKP